MPGKDNPMGWRFILVDFFGCPTEITLLQTNRNALQDKRRWVMPLDSPVHAGAEVGGPGDVLLLQAGEGFESSGGRVLIGATAERS